MSRACQNRKQQNETLCITQMHFVIEYKAQAILYMKMCYRYVMVAKRYVASKLV